MPGKSRNFPPSGLNTSLSAKLLVRPELKLTLHQKLFIELLPLTNLDLIQEVTAKAEQNPLCEIEESPTENDGDDTKDEDELEKEETEEKTEASIENYEKNSDIDLEEVFNDCVKTQWDRNQDEFSPFSYLSSPRSLKDNLKLQYHVNCDDESLYTAGELIIDSIGENGYLTINLADLSIIAGESLEKLKKALSFVKKLDPPGIGASCLEESLAIQLERSGEAGTLAFRIVSEGGLDFLKNSDYKSIARLFKTGLQEVIEASKRIKKLNPRPASGRWQTNVQHITPDFILKEERGELVLSALWSNVEIPFVRLTISRSQHADVVRKMTEEILAKKRKESDLVDFERKYNEALFLSRLPKYIKDRENSIEKVARAIVSRQFDFLKGTGPLKPLSEKEIAEETGLHPSTISRIVQNKYIETGDGIFALKHFFTGPVKTDSQTNSSSAEVRGIIKTLVESEKPSSPFTDDKLAEILKSRGFKIARRTVAKYRAVLNILPSSMRKKIEFSES